MLRIEVNNINIDLPIGASLQMNMESPFLDYSKMQGSYGFTLNVPLTKRNQLAFGFPTELDTKDYTAFTLQPTKIYDNEIFLFNAATKITNVIGNLNNSNGTCTLAIGTDLGIWGDKKLQDPLSTLDLGTITKTSTSPNPVNWWIAEVDYMNAGDYTNRNYAAFSVYCHDIYDIQSFFNLPTFTGQGNMPHYEKTFHPYLVFVLRAIFSKLGYQLLNESIITDRDFNQLAIVCLQRYLNSPQEVRNHLPIFSISDTLHSIRSIVNAGVFPSRTDRFVKVVTYNDVVSKSEVIDWTSKVLSSFEYEPKVHEGFSFRQLTDTQDSTQLNDDINFNERFLTTESNTLTGLPAPTTNGNEYAIVNNENILYTEDATRAKLAFNFSKYNQGKDDIKVESKGSGIGMIMFDTTLHAVKNVTGYTPPRFLTTRINVPNIWQHNALRLAFYRGMQAASDGQLYPLGTSGMHTFNGTSCGAWHLGWQGTNGLYNTFWKTMISHRSRWPFLITFNLKLNHNDVLALDFSKRYRIGTSEYILASANISLPLKNASEVKFWRIK